MNPVLHIAVLLAVACATLAGDPLPGFQYVGRGVDVTRIAFGGDFAEGLRNAVVELSKTMVEAGTQPGDTKWMIPKNTYTSFFPNCEYTNISRTVHAAKEYQHELSNAFSATLDYSPAPGEMGTGELVDEFGTTVTTTYTETTKKTMNYDTYLFDSQAMCQQYNLLLDYRNNSVYKNFKDAVLALPTTFDPSEPASFLELIGNFGTHVVEGFTSGGLLTQRVEMTSWDYTSLTTEGVDVSVEASVGFGDSVSAGVGGGTETSEYVAFQKVARVGDVVATGGNTTYANDFARWANSIPDNPVPLVLKPAPLFEYLTTDRFGTTVYISDRAAALNQATQYYLQTTASMPSLLPTYKTCTRKNNKFQNDCNARCSSTQVAIGGACKATGVNPECGRDNKDDCWPWRVTSSRPDHDERGWNCRVGEDHGSGTTGEEGSAAFGMVLCAERTIPLKMGPPDNQVITLETRQETCQGSEDGRYSECVARCPSGYLLTGGGCEPSGLETDHDFPFQVAASAPSDDVSHAWQCSVREDAGSPKSERALGWAMCSKWSSTAEYRPAHFGYSIQRCNSGSTSDYMNFCHAQCPTGHVLVGGGCNAVENGSRSWRITKSFPHDNGWRCVAGEDRTSKVYMINVRGYAICMKFNEHEQTPRG